MRDLDARRGEVHSAVLISERMVLAGMNGKFLFGLVREYSRFRRFSESLGV